MDKWRIWLLLIICNLFWAGNYVFGKYVIAEMTPLWITFSRWSLALLLLLPIARYMEKTAGSTVKKDWLLLLGMGVLGVIGYNLVLYSALEYTTATNAALVSALNPGVIVMFSVVLLRERVSSLQTLGFIASLSGALIVLTHGDFTRVLQAQFNLGDLLMLAAVLIWTLYSLIGRKLSTPPITATAVSAGIAVLLMAPFAAAQGIDTGKIGPLAVTGIFYMVIFPSVGSFVFWNISVRAVGASKVGVFLNLIPVFTAIISGLLGETITGAQVLGGLLVFCGVYLTTGMLERGLGPGKL
ncbi:MAG TPA: DMT family transporter [Methylomusa anaerophila]|uniref:Putative inner membrane transporter YhbE n=1 Tax=Methylomusa anaerophila TaxID=1930071 RepID=A0A348AGA6_9FIRM|nr:DMT family transporter [Methylomusa anaerophila]BBB90104.1 putative inner membrane transporter YhbE [Methylomusa anaerophila]HML88171.1 DMT family transporter [Methylomusa anaerophila]